MVVSTYREQLDANIAQSLLEANGLRCDVIGPDSLGNMYGAVVQFAPIRLRVARVDFVRAESILIEHENAAPDEPASTLPDEASETVGDDWMRRAAGAAVLGTLMFPPLLLYAVPLLVMHNRAALSDRGRRHRRIATAFAVVGAVGWSAAFLAIGWPR